MAMSKGFLAGSSQLTSSSGGSTKKTKKNKDKALKAKPGINDIYAVPGAGEARAKAMKKRDVLDYSRFDSIGAREAKRARMNTTTRTSSATPSSGARRKISTTRRRLETSCG